MSDILSLLSLPFLECLVLIGMHCYLGMHIVSRGVIFVDLSLAQIAMLGSAVALLLGYEHTSLLGNAITLGFCFAGAAIFAFTRSKDERIPQEAIIGIVYAVSAALALLALDRAPEGAEHVKELTFGSILTTSKADIIKTTILYTFIGLFHFIFRKKFIMISFETQKARQAGVNIKLWDFLFYISFGFLVTQSVGIAGVLLVFSFLIVPAVCAILFTSHIWSGKVPKDEFVEFSIYEAVSSSVAKNLWDNGACNPPVEVVEPKAVAGRSVIFTLDMGK